MTQPDDTPLTAEEAVEKALLYTFQLSGKDYRKMQTAMSGIAFIRALEQDGYTVATLMSSPNPDPEPARAAIEGVHPLGGLDAAWADAEAARPRRTGVALIVSGTDEQRLDATTDKPFPPYSARLWSAGRVIISCDADSPAAALRALTIEIRKVNDGYK